MLDTRSQDTEPQTQDKENQTGNEYTGHWFWGAVLACRRVYGQVIAASVLINLFALASSLYIMTVYDRVIPNKAIESLWALTLIMVVVMVFDFIMKVTRAKFVDKASSRVDRVVSEKLFERIARRDIHLSKQATGALANTVREFDILKEVIGSASFTVFSDLPFVFLFLIVLYLIGGPVAAVPALVVPSVILFGVLIQPIMRRLTLAGMMQGRGKQAVMVEMISGLETLKSIRGLSLLRTRWLQSVVNQSAANRKGRMASQLVQFFTQLGQQVSQVGIVVYGVFLISDGSLTMGQLIACVILSGRTLAPLGQITQLLGRMNQAVNAYKNLDEILSGESQEEKRKGHVKREKLHGDIDVRHLKFTYEGMNDPSLDDVSLSIKAGERVAVLGRIGSGKTTLLKMLAGLLEPTTGTVMIDNADIRHLRPQDVRNNIGVVLQNPLLFSGTIRENLLMGYPEASDADLIDAVKAAGAEGFIGGLPGGFDFPLTERGAELSTGMRQSIAIARALISKPSILLLDEPTASMDAGTEQMIVNTLDGATQGVTCLFITHRGSMLQLATRILIVEGGRIVADGPRDEVLQRLQAQQQPATASAQSSDESKDDQ